MRLDFDVALPWPSLVVNHRMRYTSPVRLFVFSRSKKGLPPMEQTFDAVGQETAQAELMLLTMDAGDEDLTLDDPAIQA